MSGQDNVVNFKRPREWADDCAALWFHLQELKKKMRRQFIEDFKTMISKNASTEELLDRLLKHERARRTTRDAHNVATENTAAEPTYWQLVRDLDDYGIPPEYKAHVLFCRPLTPEEQRKSRTGKQCWMKD